LDLVLWIVRMNPWTRQKKYNNAKSEYEKYNNAKSKSVTIQTFNICTPYIQLIDEIHFLLYNYQCMQDVKIYNNAKFESVTVQTFNVCTPYIQLIDESHFLLCNYQCMRDVRLWFILFIYF